MSIVVDCRCGQKITARDQDAGKTGRCPACNSAVPIPNPLPVAPSLDGEEKTQIVSLFKQMRDLLVDCSTHLEGIREFHHEAFRRSRADVRSGPSSGQSAFEYKVLTQKDKWFTSKFDPARLEEALNAYAEQGWKVVAVTTASFPGILSANREEMIVVLERPNG